MAAILALLLVAPVFGQSIVTSKFCGLNNSVDSTIIPDCAAQDLLNVETNKQGTALRKRDGTATFLTLAADNQQVSGSFGFKNPSGNEVLLFIQGGSLYRSVNQAAGVLVTTRTATSRLNCVSSNGSAYCYTSSADLPFKYDVTTFVNMTTNSYPRGKGACLSPDRQAVWGVVGSSNTVYFSKSGDIEEFDTGINTEDPWTEAIGSFGDSLTACAFHNGRWIFFKEYSVQGANCTDQYNCVFYDISNNMGTPNQENIIQHEGTLYFKGSDNKFYAMSGAPGDLEDISVDISSFTASILAGKTRNNVITTQGEFESGNLTVAGILSPVSATSTSGSIQPSSTTLLDSSQSDFAAGTDTNVSTISVVGSLVPQQSVGNAFTNAGGESFSNSINWTSTGSPDIYVSSGNACGNLTRWETHCWSRGSSGGTACGGGAAWQILDSNGDEIAKQTFSTDDNTRTVSTITLSNSSVLPNIDTAHIKVRLCRNTTCTNHYLESSYFIKPQALVISYGDADGTSSVCRSGWDIRENTTLSGDLVSRTFDTAYSTPMWGTFSVSMTSDSVRQWTFETQTSANGSSWDSLVSITPGNKPTSAAKRYIRYKASWSVGASTNTGSQIDDVSIVSASTGIYHSPCVQPGVGISSWGTFDAPGSLSCGTVAFYVSTGTTCSDVGTTWTAQSTATTIGIAVGATFKSRVDFTLNSASCTARIDSITTNWTDGTVSSPTWGAYWNDALYWTVQTAGVTNNRMLKYDLLNSAWFVFDIAANALLNFQNVFYFGATTTGKILKFSNISPSLAPTSDDGANIDAFWKSKDFGGVNPFMENVFDRISMVVKKQSGGTVTNTWTTNGGSTGTGNYTVSLSTGDNVVRSNYYLPAGTRGQFINTRISNNSTIPFEIFGFKIDYTQEDWRPLPE